MTRIEFTHDGFELLAEALADRRRILLLTNPSRRFVDDATTALGGDDVAIDVFDGARVHVPADVVRDASEKVKSFEPDAIVALGGGAATGLGKALRLEHDLFFAAVPTTYAGSEMTNIWGTTEDGNKRTGRDDRVLPDLVVYDAALSRRLPKKLTTQSLFNALAHPISALEAGALDQDGANAALVAVKTLVRAATQLAETPRHVEARADALRGASMAGKVLNRGNLGVHHKLAHFIGGRFDVEHGALHAALLPGTVSRIRAEKPELYEKIDEAAGLVDLPAQLFDLLRRAGAPTSLKDLGIAWPALCDAMKDADLPSDPLVFAHQGRRPAAATRFEDWGLRERTSVDGDLTSAETIVVALHGRGSNADAILRMVREVGGHADSLAVAAIQAPGNVWYDNSYRDDFQTIGAPIETAIAEVTSALERCRSANGSARIVLFGFSQGACLALETAARTTTPLDGLVAFAGARIGPKDGYTESKLEREGVPVRLGIDLDDDWVDVADVDATAAWFTLVGADVEVLYSPGNVHEMTARQRISAAEVFLGRSIREGISGFGNAHETEALEGAVPRRQNSPRRARYGLYAEQVNGTGFVATREQNLRTWTYRVRPTAQHTPFELLDHAGVTPDFDAPADPNLMGWAPLSEPEGDKDFVDGLVTFGGAGTPETRRGYAVHLYAANRSMDHRAFSNSDGDLLIIPQEGPLTLLTELGVLEVPPGKIAIVPRGIRFSVLLAEGFARGYVAEIYGRHFELPARGPVGANGLTDARHFVAPSAWYEDRVDPGYRLANKFAGRLYEAKQDYSPYDVVGWHGDYTPYVYDLLDFSPVSNARFDHPDPSIFTVLSCPLDEQGASALDFVFFPPRWDVGEDTFRPPFFHRNATTEINGIIKDPSGDRPPFYAGGCFITPAMTPHGIRNHVVHRIFRSNKEDKPRRTTEDSMWFQFESALPISLTRWAANTRSRLDDWTDMWGTYRTFFDPNDP